MATNGHANGNGQAKEKDPVLVVVQLSGGNDFMNTVIPFTNGHYYDARPLVHVPETDRCPSRTPSRSTRPPRPCATCTRPAPWRSSRASATRTPAARTSARWTSGTPAASQDSAGPRAGWRRSLRDILTRTAATRDGRQLRGGASRVPWPRWAVVATSVDNLADNYGLLQHRSRLPSSAWKTSSSSSGCTPPPLSGAGCVDYAATTGVRCQLLRVFC